jgi:flagellar biosynthesis/type III secretory pathway M-ring protein FliF/YscJ
MVSAGAPDAVQAASKIPALMPSKSEALLNQLQETGKKDPEVWAGVVRGWLAEEAK